MKLLMMALKPLESDVDAQEATIKFGKKSPEHEFRILHPFFFYWERFYYFLKIYS